MSDSGEEIEREELLRFVYTCPVALLLVGGDGTIRTSNGAAMSLLIQFPGGSELDNFFEFLELSRPGIQSELLSTVADKGYWSTRLTAQVGKDRVVTVQLSATSFDSGYSILAQDVSAEIENENEMQRLLAEEAEQRGKADMAAGILHDLGNALTAIGSAQAQLQQTPLLDGCVTNLNALHQFLLPFSEQLKEVLGAQKGEALIELVKGMRSDLQKHSEQSQRISGRSRLYLEHAQEVLNINRVYARETEAKYDVSRLFADVVEMTHDWVAKRHGSIVIDNRLENEKVKIDRSKAIQIFVNLVKNSLEARDARPTVSQKEHEPFEICLCAHQSEGKVEFLVKDNGPGFDSDLANKIFDKDFSTKNRGSGIGLSSCRHLARSMGGDLNVESPGLGQGATAIFCIPKEQEDMAA